MVNLNSSVFVDPEYTNDPEGEVAVLHDFFHQRKEKPQEPVVRGKRVAQEVRRPDEREILEDENAKEEKAQRILSELSSGYDWTGLRRKHGITYPEDLDRRIPSNYYAALNGQWYDHKGRPLPPPPDEFIEGVHEAMPVKIGKFLLGDYLGDPTRVVSELATGDPYQTHQVIDGLTKDTAVLLACVGPIGEAFFRAARSTLRYMVKVGKGPRFIYRELMKVVPESLRPSHYLEGVWENIIVPRQENWWRRVNPVTGRYVPTKEGMKSFVEITQPAIERLERVKKGWGTLASPFRNATTQKALITQAGRDIGDMLIKMSPQARFEAFKALRGLPAAPEGKAVVEELEKKISKTGVRKTFLAHYKQAFDKALRKPDVLSTADETLLDQPVVSDLLSTLGDSAAAAASPRRVQKLLKKVIAHPTAPLEVKKLAVDLYNLPYSTAEAVGKATRSASREFILSGLKRMGVVKLQAPKGEERNWVISQVKGLKGSYVPRDVEFELKAIEQVPKIAARTWGKYFMSPWKVSKVILSPATHVRNTVSNVILNDLGGLPFYRVDYYRKALREMLSDGRYWREWQKLTGGGGTFSLNELSQLEGGLKFGADMFDKSLAFFDKRTAPAKELYNAEEQWAKMAKFIWNLKHEGMTPREAALDAMKWTFNYGEVTRFTASVRGTVAPFYTWTSKVLPLMAETAVKHPLRLAKWWLMYQALQENSIRRLKISDSEWEYIQRIMPEYMQEGQFLLLPWRDDDGRLQFLNLTYMIPGWGDWTDLSHDPAGQFLGTPFIEIGGGLRNNVRYSGAPIWLEDDDNPVKLMKGFGFVWQQVMPSFGLFPKSVNWDKIWDRIESRPGSLTPFQLLAEEAGFKSVPLDLNVAARRSKAVHNIHLQQIGSQMKKELRRARSADEARKIIRYYTHLRSKLLSGED